MAKRFTREQRVINKIKQAGVTHVAPAFPNNVFSSRPLKPSGGSGRPSAQKSALDMVNTNIQGGGSLKQSLELALGQSGLSEATKAAQALLSGKDALVIDLETFGVPTQNRRRGEDGVFGVGQISLLKYNFKTGKMEDPNVLSVQLDEDMKKYFNQKLNELERNPMAINSWSAADRRSVADLALYQDTGHFEKRTIAGRTVSVMTGQSDRPNYLGTEMASAESIASYKKGLRNLSNPKLANSREAVYDVLDYYTEPNPILAGHNIKGFDNEALREYIAKDTSSVTQKLTQRLSESPQYDTLPVSKYNNNVSGFDTPTNQLSELYSRLDKGTMQAHFAGDDTVMTAEVMAGQLQDIASGKIKLNSSTEVGQNELFVAARGTGRFYESDFTRDRGKHDLTLRYDKENKKFVHTRTFQEPALIAGDEYQFLGSMGRHVIDGVEHEGIVFRDVTNDTYKFLFRQNEDEIGELFQTNLVKKALVGEETRQYIERDSGRRMYESLFDIPARSESDTVKKRLEYAYDVIDQYETTVKKLTEQGEHLEGRSIHEAAIKAVEENLNKDKDIDDMYRYSRSKIRRLVQDDVRDKLKGERDIWDKVGEEASRVVTSGDDGGAFANAQRVNLFYRPFYEGITADDQSMPEMLGHEGMRFLKMPDRSTKGNYTYLNVENKTDIASRLRSTVRTGDTKGKGQALNDFEHFLSGLGPVIDENKKMEYRKQVEMDFKKYGRVMPGTIDHMTQYIHTQSHLQDVDQKHIVSRIPGRNMEAAYPNGTSRSDLYINRLRSRKDTFFKEEVDKAVDRSYNSLHSSASIDMIQFDIKNLSNPGQQKLRQAQDVSDALEERALATAKMLQLNGAPKQDILKKVSHDEQIQKTINLYKSQGYDVAIDYAEESEKMFLSFSHKDSYRKVTGMTAEERLYGDGVNSVVLPMPNRDGSIPINEQNIKQNYSLRKNRRTGQWEAVSTTESLYGNIQNIPEQVDEIMEEARLEGRTIKRAEAERIAIQRAQNKARQGGIVTNFFNASQDDKGYSSSSLARNFTPMMDMNSYYEDYARRHNPKLYNQFQAFKQIPGNEYANFSDAGWGKGATHGKQMAAIRMNALFEFNETIGKQTGMAVNAFGINAKQWQSGLMNLADPRDNALFGKNNPGSREQILKTQNYHLMDRDSLESYYANRFGAHTEQTDRVFEEMTSTATRSNLGGNAEDGVGAVNVRQMYANDKELFDGMKKMEVSFASELKSLEGLSDSASVMKRTELEEALAFVRSNRGSVHEEQILGRKSLMESMVVNHDLKVSLGEGEVATDQMDNLMAAIGGDASEGTYRLPAGLTMDEMKAIGLVNKRNELTIGKVVSGAIEEEGTSKRLYEDALLEGVEYDANGMPRLIISNRQLIRDGSKFIDGTGGTRNSVIMTPDLVMDKLATQLGGHKDTDFIAEHVKTSRYPAGQLMGELVRTSYHNALDDFDSLFYEGTGALPGTQAWAEQNRRLLTGKPKDYEQARNNFLNNHFLKDMNRQLGLSEDDASIISLSPTGGILYDNDIAAQRFVGEAGGEIYRQLYDTAQSQYGFSERQVVAMKRQHHTGRWARAGHGAGYGSREINIMNQLFTNLDEADGGLGEDSEAMRHLIRISEDSTNPHHVFKGSVQNIVHALKEDKKLADVQQDGNVLFDLTGAYTYEGGENVKRIIQDGKEFFVIDGLSVSRAPEVFKRTSQDIEGTSADLMSVVLQSGDESLDSITVQKLVEASGGQAFMQIQNPNNRYYDGRPFMRDVVPVGLNMPEFRDGGFVSQQEVTKRTERIFNDMQRFAMADFSESGMDGDEIIAHLNRISMDVNQNIRGMQTDALNYLVSSSNGALMKGTRMVKGASGVSGIAGAKNIFSEDQYDIGEVFVGKNYARSLIDGNEASILAANGLNITDFDGADEAREYIMGQLSGTTGDNEFQMYTMANRFPTQSEGSVIPLNLRIDSDMAEDDNRIILSRGTSSLLGADYDGDHIFLTSYMYNHHDETDFAAVQGDLSRVHQKVRQRAQERIDAPEVPTDSFSAVRNYSTEEMNEFFQDFDGDAAQIQQMLANEMKSSGIGAIDNTVVAARDGLRFTLSAAHEAGQISSDQYIDMMDSWNNVNDKLVQNFISAKKIDMNKLADGGFRDLSRAQQLDVAIGLSGTQSDIPNLIRNVTPETVGSLMKEFIAADIVKEGTEDYAEFQKSFSTLAVANQSLMDSGVDGMMNAAFALGKNNPSEYAAGNLISGLETNPGSIIGTTNVENLVGELYGEGSDVAANYKSAQSSLRERVASNFGIRLTQAAESAGSADPFRQTMDSQVELMGSLVKESIEKKKHVQSASVSEQLMKMGERVAGSDSFRMGAGMAAMWMVSSAIKRGPTPEGNEAQQEGGMAAPEEVDPSRLLTSPTARVTPNTETVRLQISGTGNVDQDMVAGVVNSTVNQMTGMPMQMHMDITDNTQKLDRKFYEQTVNNALGF